MIEHEDSEDCWCKPSVVQSCPECPISGQGVELQIKAMHGMGPNDALFINEGKLIEALNEARIDPVNCVINGFTDEELARLKPIMKRSPFAVKITNIGQSP